MSRPPDATKPPTIFARRAARQSRREARRSHPQRVHHPDCRTALLALNQHREETTVQAARKPQPILDLRQRHLGRLLNCRQHWATIAAPATRDNSAGMSVSSAAAGESTLRRLRILHAQPNPEPDQDFGLSRRVLAPDPRGFGL